MREGWDQLDFATYLQDYYEELSTHTETFCQGLEVDLPIIFFGGDYLIIQRLL